MLVLLNGGYVVIIPCYMLHIREVNIQNDSNKTPRESRRPYQEQTNSGQMPSCAALEHDARDRDEAIIWRAVGTRSF